MVIEVRPPAATGKPPEYCCAVLVDDAGRFLLERRPLTKPDAPGRLTCFGGRREPDETPDVCIRRELHEELGAFVDAGPARWALHVDSALVAWFYAADVGALEPRLERGVDLVRLPADGLDHPDLSSWHRPLLEAFTRTGSGRT